jgi:hypothetical protein
MTTTIDLGRLRSALKGKELVGFNVAGYTAESARALPNVQPVNPEGGRPKAGALRIGIKKSGVTKMGFVRAVS